MSQKDSSLAEHSKDILNSYSSYQSQIINNTLDQFNSNRYPIVEPPIDTRLIHCNDLTAKAKNAEMTIITIEQEIQNGLTHNNILLNDQNKKYTFNLLRNQIEVKFQESNMNNEMKVQKINEGQQVEGYVKLIEDCKMTIWDIQDKMNILDRNSVQLEKRLADLQNQIKSNKEEKERCYKAILIAIKEQQNARQLLDSARQRRESQKNITFQALENTVHIKKEMADKRNVRNEVSAVKTEENKPKVEEKSQIAKMNQEIYSNEEASDSSSEQDDLEVNPNLQTKMDLEQIDD